MLKLPGAKELLFVGAIAGLALITPSYGQEATADVAQGNAKTPATDTPLDQAMHAQSGKQFTGSPITIKLKDADVHDVLRLIGETSGFNIVIHPSVAGRLTLSLEHVPWDQALDIVLTTLKLGAERNESVLRILPREMLLAEKQQEIDTQRLQEAAAPRITRVFPISYADLSQLAGLLQSFANSANSSVRATILVDQTTQSLVVRDIAENVERIRKMIEILDVQTPQVLIEAKVVEATEQASNQLGGSFGIGGKQYGFTGNAAQDLLGLPVIPRNLGGGGTGSFSAAELFSVAGRAVSLKATLDALESDTKIKVVSSPKTVVMSGKSASITQARSQGVRLTTPATTTAPATQQIVNVQANTRLNVTPRVTNDGSVLMKLDLTRDILTGLDTDAPVAVPRQMSTEVVVGSGDTLVIGGILSQDESTGESGVPILRKIPLIGWLFGKETFAKDKTELMFFVTPKVVNFKKAGIINADEPPPTAKL